MSPCGVWWRVVACAHIHHYIPVARVTAHMDACAGQKESERCMAQRQQWTFGYSAQDVLAGARKQLAHHERKTAEWREREQTREEEAQRSIIMGDTFAHIEGRSTRVAQPQYDQTKLEALYEAQRFRKVHQAKAARYRTWVSTLSVQPPEQQLLLDYDDIVYFGLAAHTPLNEAEAGELHD